MFINSTLTAALVVGAAAVEDPTISASPQFVYFGATWCQPCKKMQKETLANAAVSSKLKERFGFFVTVLDIDQAKQLAKDCGIKSVPTYLVIENGKIKARGEGYRSPALFLEWLKQSESRR